MSGAPRTPAALARLWLILATSFWGLSFPLGKTAALGVEQTVPGADGWFLTTFPLFWRFLFGAVILLLLFRAAAVPRRLSEWVHGGVLGAACGLGLLFQMTGLQTVDASASAFLTQLGCALVPLLVALDKRRWPPSRIWWALGLMLLGAAVLVRLDPRALHLGRGELLTLLGALFFAVQVYWLERDDLRAQRMLPCTLTMFLTIAAIYGVASLVLAPSPAALVLPLARAQVWVPVAGLTLVCTVAAFTVMNRYQPRVSATEAGVIYGLESVCASVFALFLPAWLSRLEGVAYPNETVTWNLVVGGACILSAVLWVSLAPPTPPDDPAPGSTTRPGA